MYPEINLLYKTNNSGLSFDSIGISKTNDIGNERAGTVTNSNYIFNDSTYIYGYFVNDIVTRGQMANPDQIEKIAHFGKSVDIANGPEIAKMSFKNQSIGFAIGLDTMVSYSPVPYKIYKIQNECIRNDCSENYRKNWLLEEIHLISSTQTVHIYPNPMHEQTSIETTIALPINFELFDTYGELIESVLITTPTSQLLKSNKPVGCYFYKISSTNGQLLQTGKLIIY